MKIFSLLLISSLLFSSTLYANNEQAYQVKAAYLYQFFKYTNWSNKNEANTIGVFAEKDIQKYFTLIEEQYYLKNKITIYSINNIEDALKCCNMIYFGPNTELKLQQLTQTKLSGVVIVADDSLTNGHLAMIQLHKKGTKLKFIVNSYNTLSQNIELSSRLLRVATKVNTDV
ncbi:YfiR family protein [Colwellia sp. UCD-KL20]|uniref:YfiR family protein n=1 Tax=Colwellia sp. UCD-KL20 TaxID=1917165 RepID=UPI0009707A30|nr:YfiR family protein [Colwellia sp. UCD-KL20]